MSQRPTILCPVDYSDASAGAVQYASAIAEHFAARLIVLTVEDPLLATAMEMKAGPGWMDDEARRELAKFVWTAAGADAGAPGVQRDYEVAVGKPAVEILRIARDQACELIVMSSHGQTGTRKLFFGSTTERVLRETTVPVLVTPPASPGPIRLEDAGRLIGRIVVPVDLSSSSQQQARVAAGLAAALDVPIVLVHVIEPVRSRMAAHLQGAGLDAERRAEAEAELEKLAAALPPGAKYETLIVHGDPAEEAAKVVRDRHAGLVVVGLHGSPVLGPRMGSVTYRMLCLTPTLVLALPPLAAQAGGDRTAAAALSSVIV